jgi:D-3-phosphoglycerate dehydrogenase
MSKFVVLFSAPYMVKARDRFAPILASFGIELLVPEVEERLEASELLPHAGKFDGAICGDDRFSAEVLQACVPRLKVIAKWGTGLDSIDRVAAARLGVQVLNTPNAFTLPVADNVLGWMLCFARALPGMDRAVKSGFWGKLPGRALSELTLGVVGCGCIGKAVIRRARAFGMRILTTDIARIAPDFLLENAATSVTLPELLRESDFVSLCCDLNPTSHHLINAQTLAQMKRSAVLINTARGPIVDEPALIAALQSGTIAGAALDVFEVEPLPKDSPLLRMDNVMLAPHNCNSSPAAWERVHLNTIANLLIGLGISCTPQHLEQLLRPGNEQS